MVEYPTLALGWFGEKELQLPEALMQDILSHSQLDFEDSMGYGEF